MEIVLDGRIQTEQSVLALGMFDGVHIGHQVLLRKARTLAKAQKAPLAACTFIKHPLELIAPQHAPTLLTTFEERAKLLEKIGVDILYAIPFDEKIKNQLPECYVGELVRRFHPKAIVCGYNHSFGKRGQGNPALLDALGCALGFATVVIPKITLDGRDVSSSEIRRLLARGDASLARQMLLRPYQRMGAVAEQDGAKCALVMPPNGKQTLPPGSYRALVNAGGKRYPTVLTIEGEGKGKCLLPVHVQKHAEIEIGFLSQCAQTKR